MSRIITPSRELILPNSLSRRVPSNRHRQRGFIINPYALGVASGGGAGLAPDAIGTTPTFWYDGDNSPQWKGNRTSDGASVADGDAMQRADSMPSTIVRCFADTGGIRKMPVQSPGNGFEWSTLTTDTKYGFYTRPSGTALPSVATLGSTLFTVSNAIFIAAINIVDAAAFNGSPYQNSRIIGDVGGYLGLFCYKSGSNIIYQAYSYTGGDHFAPATVPLNTMVIITMAHKGGSIVIRVNGLQIGAPVAAGNTDSLAGAMALGGLSILRLAQFCTYNAAVSDANILQVERYFGNKVAITI